MADLKISDLTGKVIIITGGNVGIGKALCLQLARHNPYHIYILARNANTATTTINSIHASVPNVPITFIPCNLASLSSVRSAALTLISKTSRIDLLYCNAGILGAPPSLTEDGYEIHFGTNHLGHALLIKLLLPLLLTTAEIHSNVRVISTSSDGYRFHARGGIQFPTLRTPQASLTYFGLFGGWLRYFQSKLANIIYIDELARRYPALTFVAVHPGIIDTELTPNWIKSTAVMRNLMAGGKVGSPEEGARNLVWAGTEMVRNGEYYEPVGVVGKRTEESVDKKLAERLWDFTEEALKDFVE